MESYIGTTDEGERVFIEWELKETKRKPIFSASGYYLNAAGTDCSMGGQCLDEIVKEFPDSHQAQAIHAIWSKWHLNDMTAGSPKQEALVNEVIKPLIETEQSTWDKKNKRLEEIKSKYRKVCERKKYNVSHNAETLLKEMLNIIFMDNKKITTKFISFVFTEEGVKRNNYSSGYKYIQIRKDEAKEVAALMGIGERPVKSYAYICQHLKKLGRLHDPDYIVDGVAYAYGSKWLHTDIPEDVIKEIKSWEETPAPDEPTLVQKFIVDNNVKIARTTASTHSDKWQREANAWTVTINNQEFDYFTGKGIDTEDKEAILEGAVSSIMSDALIGREDDPIEYLIDYFGYEDYKIAKKIAKDCVKTAHKLGSLFDEQLTI